MRNILGSLKYQITQHMKSLVRFGESKHEAKKQYRAECEKAGQPWNPAYAPGIFSKGTYKAYSQTAVEFTNWVKQQNPNVKDIKAITPAMASAYLKEREKDLKTAYTISKDLSAINKLFGFNLNKKELGLKERSYKNVTRSRGAKAHDSKYNPENYAKQLIFSHGSGARRQSVLKVIPENFQRDSNGQVISVWLKEKGGRERYATILNAYRAELTTIVDAGQPYEPLFDSYTTKIDNHAIRAEYAKERYNEIARDKDEIKSDYRGYDKSILKQV